MEEKKNEATGTYTITSNVDLQPVENYNASYGTALTTIGAIPYARVRVQTTSDALGWCGEGPMDKG